MSDFLSVFGAYDFVVRDGLVSCIVALAIYVPLSAGVFAIPQVGLMAVGAYTSATIALHSGLPLVVSVLAGGVVAALAGLVLAVLLIRLDGIYLAVACIAFSEVIRVAIINLPGLGHAEGLVGLPRNVSDIWIVLAVVVAAAALEFLRRSRLGLAVAAMRVDTLMAQHQGIDAQRLRVGLFGISGFLAGIGGALHVDLSGFVEPNQFNFELLTQLLAIAVVGGMLYVGGSFVGAIIIIGLPLVLTSLADWDTLANGVALVLVISFAPSGVLGLVVSAVRSRAGRALAPAGRTSSQSTTQRSAPGPRILEVGGLSVTFGGIRALDGVDMSVRSGEILGVIGPNGSGKTTLINALSGAYRPSEGVGTLDGSPMARLWGRPHRLAESGVSRTFQTIRLMDEATVATNVAVGVSGGSSTRARRAAQQLLADLGLAALAQARAGELPYGVRREVEIARALAREPRVLLLDEPTAGMSPSERERVFEVVARASAQGIAVVLVEHDVAMMRRFCDRLVVLNFGRVLADGDPDTVLGMQEVQDAYVGSGAYA